MVLTISSSTMSVPCGTPLPESVSRGNTCAMWKLTAIMAPASDSTLHGPLWIVLCVYWNSPKGYARCTSTITASAAVILTTISTLGNWVNTARHC